MAQLAAVLAAENTAPAWRSLVPIQPGGTQPPLFCIPPAGTTSINFAALVRYLGPDQPVYGLEAVGMDGKEPPHNRVEEMARHYLKEVRALQPEGPYYLVGRCFGGVVAFEMGQQLHAQGQAVGLLAMLDTGAPGPRSRLPEPDLDGLHNLPDRPQAQPGGPGRPQGTVGAEKAATGPEHRPDPSFRQFGGTPPP